MNKLQKKKLRRNLQKVKIILIPTVILAFALFLSASGYLYFFPSHMKANYYFSKAQRLDDESPYGSREAIKYYNLAISNFEAVGDRGSAVNAYIDLGLLHHKFGNITQVERMVLAAMEIGGKDIPQQMKAKAYMLLAGTVEPEKAKEYIKQAIYISGELGQRIMTIKSYFILAKIYEYKADFEDAKKTYIDAIQFAENLDSEDGFFDPEPLYADLAELYEGEGSVLSAIKYYDKALNASKNNAEHGIAAATYMKTIGDLYKQRMQITKACQNWNHSKEEYALIGKQAPNSIIELSMSNSCQNLIQASPGLASGLQNG
jgi:tetratricopeptide (TPR) repeat protein